jgi:hypothetical protein
VLGLHETVGRRELAGTALIIIGSTLAVVFGDHETRTYSNDMLVSLIGGAWFLVYAIVVAGMCVVGLMLHRKITPIKAALVEAIRRYEVAVDANDAQACDDEDAVIAGLEALYAPWIKIHPFALCALSGAFGAQSVLFGKVSHACTFMPQSATPGLPTCPEGNSCPHVGSLSANFVFELCVPPCSSALPSCCLRRCRATTSCGTSSPGWR